MFGRVIRVEARHQPEEEPFFWCDELRVHCEVEMQMGADSIAQSHVVIYNLSKDNSSALRFSDLAVSTTGAAETDTEYNGVYITVYAGYKDELLSNQLPPVIIQGKVMNSYAVRKLPNYETHLFIQPTIGATVRQTFDPVTVKDGTLKDVLEQLCAANGITPSYHLPDSVLNTSVKGQVYGPDGDFGGTLARIGQEYNIQHTQSNNGIAFYSKVDDTEAGRAAFDALGKQGDLLTVDSLLLKGAPSIGICTAQIAVSLRPDIFPGWLMDLKNIPDLLTYDSIGAPLYYQTNIADYTVIPTYLVNMVIHKFDNFNEEWVTILSGTAPSTGDIGEMEKQ